MNVQLLMYGFSMGTFLNLAKSTTNFASFTPEEIKALPLETVKKLIDNVLTLKDLGQDIILKKQRHTFPSQQSEDDVNIVIDEYWPSSRYMDEYYGNVLKELIHVDALYNVLVEQHRDLLLQKKLKSND